jgi:hypothetical protein
MSALEVGRITAPGMHRADDGLYLQVKDAASRSWIHRYTFKGKGRWSGLPLSGREPRDKRNQEREQIRSGVDPVVERKLKPLSAEKPKKTFRDCAGGGAPSPATAVKV